MTNYVKIIQTLKQFKQLPYYNGYAISNWVRGSTQLYYFSVANNEKVSIIDVPVLTHKGELFYDYKILDITNYISDLNNITDNEILMTKLKSGVDITQLRHMLSEFIIKE